MNTRLVRIRNQKYLETLPGDGTLSSEADALDVVATCIEEETKNLMIHAEQLDPAFFQLKSGLAGAVLLKFGNYEIRCAAVVSEVDRIGGRFQEFAMETNRGDDFRVFSDKETAEVWLIADPPPSF